MPKKKPKSGKPKVNPELEGLEIKINEFGEIQTNYDIKKINKFLNRNVDDKKLAERKDYKDIQSGKDVDNTALDEEEENEEKE